MFQSFVQFNYALGSDIVGEFAYLPFGLLFMVYAGGFFGNIIFLNEEWSNLHQEVKDKTSSERRLTMCLIPVLWPYLALRKGVVACVSTANDLALWVTHPWRVERFKRRADRADREHRAKVKQVILAEQKQRREEVYREVNVRFYCGVCIEFVVRRSMLKSDFLGDQNRYIELGCPECGDVSSHKIGLLELV